MLGSTGVAWRVLRLDRLGGLDYRYTQVTWHDTVFGTYHP
jgi:hypothetical protein